VIRRSSPGSRWAQPVFSLFRSSIAVPRMNRVLNSCLSSNGSGISNLAVTPTYVFSVFDPGVVSSIFRLDRRSYNLPELPYDNQFAERTSRLNSGLSHKPNAKTVSLFLSHCSISAPPPRTFRLLLRLFASCKLPCGLHDTMRGGRPLSGPSDVAQKPLVYHWTRGRQDATLSGGGHWDAAYR
jgi:hypothetical protein